MSLYGEGFLNRRREPKLIRLSFGQVSDGSRWQVKVLSLSPVYPLTKIGPRLKVRRAGVNMSRV